MKEQALAPGRGGPRQDRRGADREPRGQRRDRARLRGAREGGPGAGGRDGGAQPAVGGGHRAGHAPAALAVAAARGDRGRDRPARGAARRRVARRRSDSGARRPSTRASTRSRATSPRCASRSPRATSPPPRAQERLTVTETLAGRLGAGRFERQPASPSAQAELLELLGVRPPRAAASGHVGDREQRSRRGRRVGSPPAGPPPPPSRRRGAALAPPRRQCLARVVEEVAVTHVGGCAPAATSRASSRGPSRRARRRRARGSRRRPGSPPRAATRSPSSSSSASAPQVPIRISGRAPRPISSSTTIAALGPPIPVDCTVSGAPSRGGAGVAPQAAVVVEHLRLVEQVLRDVRARGAGRPAAARARRAPRPGAGGSR